MIDDPPNPSFGDSPMFYYLTGLFYMVLCVVTIYDVVWVGIIPTYDAAWYPFFGLAMMHIYREVHGND